MRMASWHWGGRDHAGIVAPGASEALPPAPVDALRGGWPPIQMLKHGDVVRIEVCATGATGAIETRFE